MVSVAPVLPMPHHFVDRPRIPVVFARSRLASHDAGWQMVNAAAYLAGGLLFMWGSVPFFPAFSSEENLGAWMDKLLELLSFEQ